MWMSSLSSGFSQLRLHRLRLRQLLRDEALALEHVHEVHVAAEVQLVRPVELHAAVLEQLREHPVDDRGADLALDVVADDRQARLDELARPRRFEAMNTGRQFTKADAGVDRALRVELRGLFGADREVAHEHVGLGVAQRLGHVDLGLVGLSTIVSR